jgi:hypothetical protein
MCLLVSGGVHLLTNNKEISDSRIKYYVGQGAIRLASVFPTDMDIPGTIEVAPHEGCWLSLSGRAQVIARCNRILQ